MAYDDQINENQGAIKVSELFTDEVLEIIKNSKGESALNTVRLMMKPIGDAIRMNNFILHSDGQINWDGSEIQFDSDAQDNDIILSLLMVDENKPDGSPAARTIDIYLNGTTGANSATEFNNITLADKEMIYMEIDRDQLLAAVSPSPGVLPARFDLGNNAGGSSITVGARLNKVSLSDTSGMPAMLSTESGITKSQTVNIPIAVRYDWSDGIDTFNDLWWIPHGIRWIANTRSAIGAVVVRGLETYASLFVRSQFELQQAVTDLGPTGGIIQLEESFVIDSVITIPPGVMLLARSNLQDGGSSAIPTITVGVGGQLVLSNRAKMFNINIESVAGYGTSFTESIVLASGDNTEIRDCSFRLINASGDANCINITGDETRIWNTKFRIASGAAYQTGIVFTSGSNNIDTDSIFDYS